jgi:preprotein translocase subunit SecE
MFEIYKKGQGVTARWIAAAALGALAAFGCYELEEAVSAHWPGAAVLGVSVGVLVAAVIFIGAAVLVAMIVNMPRFVDYLIHSETELRKVSWPTKDELKRQTTVVIFTLVLFAVILLVADFIFATGSRFIYKF